MSRRFLIPALLCFAPVLMDGCGGQASSSGGAGTGGTISAGGTTASGGVGEGSGGTTTATGGTASGGTTATGPTTTASGGAMASGGVTTESGGTTSATGGRTGGRTGSGGATTAAGGATTASGGATTAAGGIPGSGGAITGSGGATTATGGAPAGGTTGAGGAAGSGGATSAGGRSGTGGSSAGGLEVWVSPNGNDDTGTGTKDSPLFSLCWDDGDADPEIKKGACYKVCPVGSGCNPAGGTVWVMDGTYKYKVTQKFGSKKPATANGVIKVFAAEGAKPVLDFSALPVDDKSRGLQIGSDYWHFKGLTVTNAGDTGIFVMGSHITVEQCIAHHNKDAGIVIGVNSDVSGSGSNNLILNCDSYQNNDTQTNGENADGFGAKENPGSGNIFRGCRAWDNADDGWDFYGWASPITVENCWAISQAKTTRGSNSDGNGFKLGGDSVSAAHILKDLYAVDNNYGSSNCGFTNNSNPASMTCTGKCAAWGNGTASKNIGGVGTTAPGSATADKMINAKRNADGSLPDINSL
jgi:hypothetical protein